MKTSLRRLLLFIITLLFCCQHASSQCIPSFTYAQPQGTLYSFTNTSTTIDTTAVTWYVQGPNLVYVSTAASPSFYFPVNGNYYVNMSTTYCGYIIDTIVVNNLSVSGTCTAGMNYYPTYASNFEFTDVSVASDSIINYTWHGFTPPDSFIMVNGWEKNTDLSLWSYNGCEYPLYVITHSITTISGCQSSIIDTVHDYCAHCGADLEPGIRMRYDSLTGQLVFTDTVAAGQIAYTYWRFGTADNNTVFSNADSPAFIYFSDTLHVVCLDVYDTVNHCTSSVCDSITAFLPTGVPDLNVKPMVELFQSSGLLQIRYSNIDLSGIEIYDMLGNRILASRIYSSPASVPLPPLSSGVYFARMLAGNSSICRKFLVK